MDGGHDVYVLFEHEDAGGALEAERLLGLTREPLHVLR